MTGVRAGIRRTPLRRAPEPGPPDLRLRVSRCGRSRLPAPAGWAGTLQGRVQASVDKLGRAHAARISAILSDAALRWDCLREAWLGDVMIFPEVADFSTFGPKTDTTLCGQAAVLPASEASNSGLRALQEGTRARLLRLAAHPQFTLQQMADRFRASRSAREISQGSPPSSPTGLMIFAPWPPRCTHAGGRWPGTLPAHLRRVPKHASRRDAEKQRSRFMGCRRSAPILAGVEVGGFGTHSFRRGSAVALFHSGADRVAVAEALRCRSLFPT